MDVRNDDSTNRCCTLRVPSFSTSTRRNVTLYRCARRDRRGSAIADVRRGRPNELFPFDQETLLDAAPMRPGKRMPILLVEPSGNAKIDLWCKSVPARIEISDMAMKIEPGPMPEGLPEMLSAGQSRRNAFKLIKNCSQC